MKDETGGNRSGSSSVIPHPSSFLRHTFPPSHRLSGKLAFRHVFDHGVKASKGPLTLYLVRNTLGHPRLGLTVSRRVGIAAKRARIKRMLRESYRHFRHDIPEGLDLVLVVRPHRPMELASYQKLLSSLFVKAYGMLRKAGSPEPAE